jgi:8-amino-7-oxononanoate synthase
VNSKLHAIVDGRGSGSLRAADASCLAVPRATAGGPSHCDPRATAGGPSHCDPRTTAGGPGHSDSQATVGAPGHGDPRAIAGASDQGGPWATAADVSEPAGGQGPFADLAADLGRLTALGRRRTLQGTAGFDFTSNDYLGFADSIELREATRDAVSRGVPVGAGGSRLLRGNHPEHEALEQAAAAYFAAESALYFGSGFAANLTLFATAPQRGDLVVHDEWIHASVLDGLRRGRAEVAIARHNDAQSVEDAVVRWRVSGGTGRVWIVVESVYSMDGDGPDLAELHDLADRLEAIFVIDEAHATGVLGPSGRGRAAFLEGCENVVTVHTCGKALGTAGALICGPRILKDFLVNRGRPFIFSTAPPPLIAAVTRAAIVLCEQSDSRRERLQRLVEFAGSALARHCGLAASGSHILPVVIGEDHAAARLAATLRAQGYDVRAIRPPTVPAGTARLRIALTLNVDEAAIEGLFQTLAADMAR